MTERTATLESLAWAWQADLEALHYWGHEPEARIVARCCDKLAAQLEGRRYDRVHVGTMLKLWSADAKVLEAYGYPGEARALRRCVEELRSTVSGGAARAEGAPGLRSPDVSMPYRPRSRTSARGAREDAGAGPGEPEESPAPDDVMP